eukprot:TRINITY_DN2564_c0_g4_i1.p1 TRINITY_DN2564_c0_g4~~TRINITY_DN2564_c0_g4_i1.p1  ORF type:complete len:241 (-),score=46.03 TRINITY_DN2564_c0_g4_i1:26-748(-)
MERISKARNSEFAPVKYWSKFVHSGLTHSKCDRILVLKNNAISVTNLKATSTKFFQAKRYSTAMKKRSSLTTSNYLKSKSNTCSKGTLLASQISTQPRTKEILSNTSSMPRSVSLATSVLHPQISRQESEVPITRKARALHQAKSKAKLDRWKWSVESPWVNVGVVYKSGDDVRREEYKEGKSRWMTKQGFMAYGEKHCKGYRIIENYVGKDPSEPPVLHNFRSVHKGKWVSGTFKLSCV